MAPQPQGGPGSTNGSLRLSGQVKKGYPSDAKDRPSMVSPSTVSSTPIPASTAQNFTPAMKGAAKTGPISRQVPALLVLQDAAKTVGAGKPSTAPGLPAAGAQNSKGGPSPRAASLLQKAGAANAAKRLLTGGVRFSEEDKAQRTGKADGIVNLITPSSKASGGPGARRDMFHSGGTPRAMPDLVFSPSGASNAGAEAGDGARTMFSSPNTPRNLMRAKAVERCSRCTIDAVWVACDVFWEFDQTHSGMIQRRQYIKCIAEPANVLRMRLLRRAKLEDRFRASAQPVSLMEWLKLIWPQASEQDIELMIRWSQLREAWSVMNTNADKFRGLESDMRRIFEFLDGKGEGKVRLGELTHAQILPADELRRITKDPNAANLEYDLDTFRNTVWPELKVRYLRPETIAKMKREEEESMKSNFGAQLSALGGARPQASE